MKVIRLSRCFFPPPPILRLVMEHSWRTRLRDAVARSGRKHSAIARDAGMAPETLSRILNATHRSPSFDSIVRIAHAVNEKVGWLLGEHGFPLTTDEQTQLQHAVRVLDDALRTARWAEPPQPNALPAGAPGVDIPRMYLQRGARLVYRAAGDSMIGAGLADGDLLFVKPVAGTREGAGQIVVCRVGDAEYVKVLDVRGGRIRLLSRNDRHLPIEVNAIAQPFALIGVVVGRTGALL